MYRIVARNIRQGRGQLASCLAGVAAGVAVLVFFLALADGLRAVLRGEIFPVERLEVVPSGGGISTLGILTGRTRRVIHADEIEALERIEHVEAVYPRLSFEFPAKAWGGEKVFGQKMWTEMVGDGIPSELVAGKLDPDTPFEDRTDDESGATCERDADCPQGEYCLLVESAGRCSLPVPFLVSRYIVELYNGALSGSHDLPPLPEWVIEQGRGMLFHMDVGRSTLGRAERGTPRTVQIVFAGVSRQAVDIGITVPLAYVERWNTELAGQDAAQGYTSATVLVRDPRHVTRVTEDVKRMGLAIRSSGAEQVGILITLFEATFVLMATIILIVSSLGITHAFYLLAQRRTRQIAVMRAVGATRSHIASMFLAEGVVVGVAGSLVGVLVAFLVSMVTNVVAARHLPEFPFKPDDFFTFTPATILAGLAVGVFCSLVGAVLPAIRASRRDPRVDLG